MAESNSTNPSPHQAQASETPPRPQQSTNTIDKRFQQPNSTTDSGLGRRPRDARLIHMILANQGVAAYQERVPLQLLDFCYRYTSSTLQDALHLTSEYGQNVPGTGKINNSSADSNTISLQSLKLSIASRTQYQFSPSLPKEYLLELAQEKNRIALPPVGKDWGLRLPPERYCLTGVGYGLKEEWESEGEEDTRDVQSHKDAVMDEDLEAHDDEDGDAKMEDFFGEDINGGDVKDMEH